MDVFPNTVKKESRKKVETCLAKHLVRGRESNNEGSKVFLNTLRKQLRNEVETFIWFGDTPCWKVFSEERYKESSENAFLNTVRKVLRN
jgi:hypothetical protein